jgi:CubicO group peptidase (beta-lactamase class C family)
LGNPVVDSSDVQHASIAELVPELDRLAVDSMADWKVPGAAMAVVQDGKDGNPPGVGKAQS